MASPYNVKDWLWRELGDEMWYFLSRQIFQTWIDDTGSNHKTWANAKAPSGIPLLDKSEQYDEITVFDENMEDYKGGQYRHELLNRQFVEYRMFHDEALARTLKMYTPKQIDAGMAHFNRALYIPFYLEYDAQDWERGWLDIRQPPEGLPEPFQMVINPPPAEYALMFAMRMAAMRKLSGDLLSRWDQPWLHLLAQMTMGQTPKGTDYLVIDGVKHVLNFDKNMQIIIHFDEIERKAGERTVDVKLTATESKVDALEREFEHYIKEHPDAPRDYPTIAVLMDRLEYFELREKLGERL
jgi:hypothetical protein